MPFQNLIIFLNNSCPVSCRTCNISAVPGKGDHLSLEMIGLLFKKIKNVEINKFIIWTGGEPFLSFKNLKSGIKTGEDNGFSSEILTSGIWFRDNEDFPEELKDAGNFSLRVSIDVEHEKVVKENVLTGLIEKCIKLGIDVNFTVRDIPGEPDVFKNLSKVLRKDFPDYYRGKISDSRWVHRIPHTPVCKDDPYRDFFVKKGGVPEGRCKAVFRDLVAGWDGNLYPCCGLFSIPRHRDFSIGNIEEIDFTNISKILNGENIFSKIAESGPSGLCRNLGVEPDKLGWGPYQNLCHLCIAVLNETNLKFS
ncbi:MAG: radical SAM protein [Acidobacteriota bacterium]